MLYDPKWEAKTKEPSLAGFIAWLETQDPSAQYSYFNICGECAVSGYFVSLTGSVNEHYGLWDLPLSRALDDLAFLSPQTYGALLDRARKSVAAS